MDATARGEGVRLPWSAVPEHVVASIGASLGSPVVSAADRVGGFSPGPTAVLALADGRQVFVKAVSELTNADSVAMHRREALIVAALPEEVPAPALLGTVESDRWFALVYEVLDGKCPRLPWRRDDLEAALSAIAALGRIEPAPSPVLRPAPDVLASVFGSWAALAEDPPPALDPWSRLHLETLAAAEAGACEAVAGTALLHNDLRADNILIHDGCVAIVDWAIGAAWFDAVMFAVPTALQGGPPPSELLARLDVDGNALTTVVTANAGFFTRFALLPDPPGLPTVRAFQAAQGEVARRWAAQRLGLPLPASP